MTIQSIEAQKPRIAEPMKLEVTKMLTVSIAHTTMDDREMLLERATAGDGCRLIVYASGDPAAPIFEALIEQAAYSEDDSEQLEGMSTHFVALVQIARRADCTWLRIHPDGPCIHPLETFDA